MSPASHGSHDCACHDEHCIEEDVHVMMNIAMKSTMARHPLISCLPSHGLMERHAHMTSVAPSTFQNFEACKDPWPRTVAGAHGLHGDAGAEAIGRVLPPHAQRAVGRDRRQLPRKLVQVHLPVRRSKALRKGNGWHAAGQTGLTPYQLVWVHLPVQPSILSVQLCTPKTQRESDRVCHSMQRKHPFAHAGSAPPGRCCW